jgi:hypothetical protein
MSVSVVRTNLQVAKLDRLPQVGVQRKRYLRCHINDATVWEQTRPESEPTSMFVLEGMDTLKSKQLAIWDEASSRREVPVKLSFLRGCSGMSLSKVGFLWA